MVKPTPGIIAARSEAMSSVFLTGDLDVAVMKVGDLGPLGDVDQLAILRSGEANIQKIFGVIVKGTSRELPNVTAAEKHLNPWMTERNNNKKHPALPLPTIVVLFSMYDDRGYFAWHTEPATDRSRAHLNLNARLTCQSTMGGAIKDIVKKVSDWYDDFFRDVFLTP